jgi:hypothetical protein
MQREHKALLLMAAVIVGGTGAALAALAMRGRTVAADRAAAAHTLFHIGCMHHSHGPLWHAGHGRSASYRRPVGGAGPEPGVPVKGRALTAGRNGIGSRQ